MSFFAELKRRNVYRVAVLYVLVGWLILQVTDVLASVLQLPDWIGKLVVVLLVIGFPVALVFAWAFELTPEGLKRDRDVSADHAPVEGRRRRLDVLIFGALVIALGYFVWQHDWGNEEAGGAEIRSLAVLPLDNLMNDPEQAFFVAGMHEALITELSRIDELRVISRTSAMAFRDSGKSVPDIARELNVDAVIEGSVLKAGDTVRVTVQLIEAETDRHLWAENYDRPLVDILALYGDVTREIAQQIHVTLSPEEAAQIEAAEAVDPEVYQLYLKGRYLCDIWSPAEMQQGIELLQQAVGMEPQNARAQAQLAICLQYSAFFGYRSALEVAERSKAAAQTAVRLDKQLAEAHVALAGVQYYLEYQPRAALRSLETSLELNPASVRALLHASWLLGESGRVQQALEHTHEALRLDPLSTVVNHALGQVHYLARHYERALEAFGKTLDLDRSDPSLHYSSAWPHEQMGNYEKAIASHRRAIELSGNAPLYRAGLGYTYGLAGMDDEATALLDSLLEDPAAAAHDVAIVYLGLGELESAMDWLEKSFQERDSQLIYINRGPRFDPLRENPRFIRLIERIDWPEPE